MSPAADTIDTYENDKTPAPGGKQMLKRFSTVLLQNSSKRALASLVNAVSVEIATRRDTASTLESQAVLEELFKLHDALTYSWSHVNSFCSPEVYAASFDGYTAALPALFRKAIIARVRSARVRIMEDLESPLFASTFSNPSKIEATEKVLVLVAA